MKKLIICLTLLCSLTSFAETQKVKAETGDGYQILDLVVGVHSTYSQASELEAKVIELLGGDGMNPTRIAVSFNTGYAQAAKVYMLDYLMLYQVTRITFLAKDVLVVNYIQDRFSDPDATVPVQIKKSLKITVQRDENNNLTDEILTEELN